MTTATTLSTSAPVNTFSSAPVEETTDATIGSLPEPSADALTSMMSSGDIGSTVAALVMLSDKERRETASIGRDAAYAAQESAQKEQLSAMEDAASTRLVTGLVTGGLQLGSAGCSLAAGAQATRAAECEAQVASFDRSHVGPLSATDSQFRTSLVDGGISAKSSESAFTGSGKGLDAYSTLAGAGGNFLASNADRRATEAGQRADNMKRIGEDYADDVRAQEQSINKTIQFLNDWSAARDAARNAALFRA